MTDQTRGRPVSASETDTPENELTDGGLALVGTMAGPSHGRALLRHDGKVHMLRVGDSLDRATVVAVSEGVVVLNCDGETVSLQLQKA